MSKACLRGMKTIIPEPFCWKKDVDFGIRKGCHDYEIEVGSLCVQNCLATHTMMDGNICAENCKDGYSAKGMKCVSSKDEY